MFSQYIIQNGTFTVTDYGYVEYYKFGFVNDTAGIYEVGGYWMNQNFLVTHSFFGPIQ